jgi:hypothetical protein
MVLGIDGLGWENLKAFGLNRLAERVKAGILGNPKVENIISRGWCEIYSGKDCYETGAFFQVPVKSGKRIVASQATGALRVDAHVGNNQLLWHRLNALGASVGIFSIPTVTKPFELDGFVVAGTGGGSFGQGMGAASVWPADLFKHRRAAGADLGFRYGYGAFLPKSIDDLELAANAHLAIYFHELRMALTARPVDVAFIGTRFITEMGYKFHQLITSTPSNEAEVVLKALVLDLCEIFDQLLDEFIDAQAPEALFVVSDHGLGSFTHRINLNHALVLLGHLKVNQFRSTARHVRHIWRSRTQREPINPSVGSSYDFAGSTAFSIGYTNTIYINDARFFGPDMTDADREAKAHSIALSLSRLCASEPGMAEVTFKKTGLPAWTSANVSDRLPQPDIKAHFPNGLANLSTEKAISTENICDFGVSHFARGVPGEYSGIKTDDTFFAYVGPNSDRVVHKRLTDLYGSIIVVAEMMT